LHTFPELLQVLPAQQVPPCKPHTTQIADPPQMTPSPLHSPPVQQGFPAVPQATHRLLELQIVLKEPHVLP
jgi:hypothetical protein